MEEEDRLGVFQICFFLAILFFVLAMFAIPNMMLFIIFLAIALLLVLLTCVIATEERSKRTSYNKESKGRIVPYL